MVFVCRTAPERPGRAKLRAALEPSEFKIQIAVVAHLKACGVADIIWWRTPTGEERQGHVGLKLLCMDTRAGLPDLIFLRAGQLYGLELKRTFGRLSEVQSERLAELKRAGARVAVAYGLDAAIEQLEGWELLRPMRA